MVVCAKLCMRKHNRASANQLKAGLSGAAGHLLFAARYDIVLSIFGVCLDFNALLTAWSCHCKRPYLCAVVLANFLLFGIESYTFAYQVPTTITPYIEWHLKPVQAAW